MHFSTIKDVDFAFSSALATRAPQGEPIAMTAFKDAFDSKTENPIARSRATAQLDWPAKLSAAATSAPRLADNEIALFMSESIDGLNLGAHFLDRLSSEEKAQVLATGRAVFVPQGEMVFSQGEYHDGIFIIRRGQVRVYYTAPSGREITLAYWTAGHFIGGPEISGFGAHMWSGVAIEDCEITALSRRTLQTLLLQIPSFALAMIDGLIAKGKCYSSMAQMLGTRSVIERLAQYLLNLAALYGTADGNTVLIARKVTHDQIAAMVGSTRQWVTMMLKRFQNKNIICIDGSSIRINRLDLLKKILFKD
ncbi:CRP/FNR family cyclic AMP-dependent transcriptional regulator [Bradyrhizobium sp. USDA 4506]